MVSREEIERDQQDLFQWVNNMLLSIAAAVALGVGVNSFINETWFVWSIVLAVGSFGANFFIITIAYRFTVGRGASASMVGATFLAWIFFSLGWGMGVTLLLLLVTGQIH